VEGNRSGRGASQWKVTGQEEGLPQWKVTGQEEGLAPAVLNKTDRDTKDKESPRLLAVTLP
jgi:hypothetical protein